MSANAVLSRRAVVAVAFAAALVLLYLFVDAPLARALAPYKDSQPRIIDDTFELARTFGQWLSLILVCVIVLVMDPNRKKDLVRLLLAVIIASIIVNVLKLVLGRVRPEEFAAGAPMWKFLGGFERHSRYTSFPSAHATAAFALAYALAFIYPRGRRVWYALAVLCAISRIGDVQHYPSDTLAGAGLGLAVAYFVFRRPKESEAPGLPASS
jgi:membrane-associated phospholipid phosphatase